MKKRSIISILLIIAMVFSIGAFTSCVNEEKEVEINVNLKIKGTKIDATQDFKLTAAPSDLTVLYVTEKMCKEIENIDFEYDLEMDVVKKIDVDIGELFMGEYETEPVEEEGETETEEILVGGEEETTEAAVKDFYFHWVCTVNDKEAKLSDKIKEGDKIVWVFKEVPKALEDKK